MPPRVDAYLRRAAALALLALWVTFSWPELRASAGDRTTAVALAAAVAAALFAGLVAPVGRALRSLVLLGSERVFVGLCAAASAAITAWVHRVPMHGQVVSGDACMYVAQAPVMYRQRPEMQQ